MLLLKIDELEEGMILKRDIKDDSGRFIISSGTVLSSKHLRVLRIWGIGEAYVLRDKNFQTSTISFEQKNTMFDERKNPSLFYKDKDICAETAKKKFMFNDVEDPFISELLTIYLSQACKEK
jgi:hypothetical protein